MRIIEDVKLDFKDVLITPKRSALASRSLVNLERTFTFRSGNSWKGVPIIAANMDGVGTLQMDEELNKLKMMVAVTKHYSQEDLIDHFIKKLNSSVYSMGISDADLYKFNKVVESNIVKHWNIKGCIDVATVAVPAVIVQTPAPRLTIVTMSPAANNPVSTVIVVAPALLIEIAVPASAATSV